MPISLTAAVRRELLRHPRPDDVDVVVGLFRMSYERAVEAQAAREVAA